MALDAEAELSNDYGVEHLYHGWISAFHNATEVITKHYGSLYVYHKGVKKYVTKIVKKGLLELKDPKTRTDLAVVAGVAGVALLIGLFAGYKLKK